MEWNFRDSLEAGLELGPVGRSIEGIKFELSDWGPFCEEGGACLDVSGCGISVGAIMEEED